MPRTADPLNLLRALQLYPANSHAVPEDNRLFLVESKPERTARPPTSWVVCTRQETGFEAEPLRTQFALDAMSDGTDELTSPLAALLAEEPGELPLSSPAPSSAFALDEGAIFSDKMAYYDLSICDEAGPLAGRFSFAVSLDVGSDQWEPSIALSVVLEDLRVLQDYRGRGVARAALVFITDTVSQQLSSVAQQLGASARCFSSKPRVDIDVVTSGTCKTGNVLRRLLAAALAKGLQQEFVAEIQESKGQALPSYYLMDDVLELGLVAASVG